MEKLLKFKEKKGSFSYLIKIRTDGGSFSKYSDLLDIGFLNSITNYPIKRKEDFFVHLKYFCKNSKNSYFNKRIYPINVSLDKTYERFLFSTSYGSFIRGNFTKGYGEGRILEKDIYKHLLLYFLTNYCFLYNFSTRVHAALVESGNTSFLLAGHRGAGKSTICKLLEKTRGHKVLHEDQCFVISNRENTYVFSLAPENLREDNSFGLLPCSSIFFIQLDKTQKSRIYPISEKDAYKRIISLSKPVKYRDDRYRNRRVENLNRMVKNCRCFLLINGKDLKNNPKRLGHLLFPPPF